jgi:Domain of unknown function (DU1801)
MYNHFQTGANCLECAAISGKEDLMAEPKTKLTDMLVADFINAIPDEQVRQDCWTITGIMQEATQARPRMWGTAIVGFGQYLAVNASGKGYDWMLIGFSPRKQDITLYLMLSGIEHSNELLAKLGKHTQGKGCLYIKRLSDVDLATLKEIVRASVAYVGKKNPGAGGQK